MTQFLRKVPELTGLILLTVVGYLVMGWFNQLHGTEVLSANDAWLLSLASFVFSLLIAVVAVIGGIGGGLLFTPVMLAFTSVDSLVIRSTGLVVAMFSGLISSGPFMRQGLADIRLIFLCAVPITGGAIMGSKTAIGLHETMGVAGDAWVRLALGIILAGVAVLLILGGSSTEYPKPRRIDGASRWLDLRVSYYEASLAKSVDYQVNRVVIGALLFLAIGFIGGFFGVGGGWAVVPALNLVMAVPLKVSAASSGILLALGNASAIWSYILVGSLIAVFAAPWMLGQVIGGILGAHVLARVKAVVVRRILIAILVLTCVKLFARSAEGLLGVAIPIL